MLDYYEKKKQEEEAATQAEQSEDPIEKFKQEIGLDEFGTNPLW